MKSFIIDEISKKDMEKIRQFLKENSLKSSLDAIFWVSLPEDILNEEQYSHETCKPHVFAVELGQDWVKMEFLIRNLSDMKCTCTGYCTRQQRDFILNFAEHLTLELDITC